MFSIYPFSRLRRLSSIRFLNFIAQRNLARVATDSGRALALASKTPREAIEGIMVSLRLF
jgi:hypothetical protein